MKIVAASISQMAESFLHPGYISAYPRPVDSYAYNPTGESYEVAEALRLTNESLASAGGLSESTTAVASTASSWTFFMASMLCCIGVITTACIYRNLIKRHMTTFGWRAIAPLGASACAIFIFATCGTDLEPLPETIPWEGAELRDYENPELATLVLIHGIITPAIVNVGQPIANLANIQNEVGLPTQELTEGEAYAVQNYGLDGWGREMELTVLSGSYIVTSAGPDGELETADDIEVTVTQTNNSEFDYERSAFFLRRVDGDLHVFFHRWNGDLFEYNHRDEANVLTGSTLFDFWQESELEDSKFEQALAAYDAIDQEVEHEPLVLQIP